MSDLRDVQGAAAYLSVSEVFMRRLVVERRVRYYKIGKFVRFKASDLDAMVDAGRVDPMPVPAPRLLVSTPTRRRNRHSESA